jgi:hypothetical protein
MSHENVIDSAQDIAARHELLPALAKKLAPLGGTDIEDTRQEHLKEVLEHGRQFTERVQMVPGTAAECHQNAAKLWAEDPKANLLATGYALVPLKLVTEDGPRTMPIWFVHSWVLRGKKLIETTFKHDAYFGVVLPAGAAYKYFSANVIARVFPGGEMSDELQSRYEHLRPYAMEALKETMDELPAGALLDHHIDLLRSLGAPGPLLDRFQKMKEGKQLGPEQASFLRAGLLKMYDFLARLGESSKDRPDK